MTSLPQQSQFLIYQTESGDVKIDVRFEEETVWLTQPLMAELFQTTQQNISLHLQNVYEEGELLPEATHKEGLLVRREGSRDAVLLGRRLLRENLQRGVELTGADSCDSVARINGGVWRGVQLYRPHLDAPVRRMDHG
jgi:hypothetical protein